ncbi:MAG: hypothetical protein JRF63_04035, partial [Deltaproteobacteria bacterium]|nr:hypothetical protein [Deltaproteobacteria bacterium]
MIPSTLRQIALAATIACAVLISGCCEQQEARIAKLEEVNSTLESELGKIKERIPNINELVQELGEAKSEIDGVEARMAERKAREELAEKR